MDNKIQELNKESLEFISNCELHPKFLPINTYDMVQSGYPRPIEGIMMARDCGGSDEKGRLLPSDGMWVKLDDVKKLLKKHGLNLENL